MERKEREAGTIQAPAAPRGWLGIGHHFINDRVAYSEKNPEYNFFWHTSTHTHSMTATM